MRSDWHFVVLHFLSAFLRWRLASMISLFIQWTLDRNKTFFNMIGAWRSERRRSMLLYRSTSFSRSASRSKVLSFRKLMCFTVGDGLGAETAQQRAMIRNIPIGERFSFKIGNLRATTKSVDWEKTGTRTSVSAGKRKLKMQSVGRSTTTTLNVNANLKLWCLVATNFFAMASSKTIQDLIF